MPGTDIDARARRELAPKPAGLDLRPESRLSAAAEREVPNDLMRATLAAKGYDLCGGAHDASDSDSDSEVMMRLG